MLDGEPGILQRFQFARLLFNLNRWCFLYFSPKTILYFLDLRYLFELSSLLPLIDIHILILARIILLRIHLKSRRLWFNLLLALNLQLLLLVMLWLHLGLLLDLLLGLHYVPYRSGCLTKHFRTKVPEIKI